MAGTSRLQDLIIGGAVSVRHEIFVSGHRYRRRRQAQRRHHRRHARGLASDVRAAVARVQLGGRRALAGALPGVALLPVLGRSHQRDVGGRVALAVAALSRRGEGAEGIRVLGGFERVAGRRGRAEW